MLQHDRLFRIRTLAALSLLLLAPLAAEAGGEVKGVSASPSPANAGTPVTITVTGKGDPCQNLDLDFGDGTPHTTYSGPLDPPKSFPHTYTTAGNKTIIAKGVNTCQKEASTVLTIQQPSIAQLCATINCGAIFACVTPKIEQVLFFSKMTPGGTVALKGCGFGGTAGQLFLTGLTRYTGEALAPIPLTILEWKGTLIGATIPSTITAVKDQQVKLHVKTYNNVLGNEYPVNFRATQEVKLLPYHDVKVVFCSADANMNWCNGTQPGWGGVYQMGLAPDCGHTYWGSHGNCLLCVGDDTGTDIFEITLKNGWLFDSFQKEVKVAPGEGWAQGPSGFPPGGTYWKPQVKWTVTPNDYFCYGGWVYIAGPKGVSWK